MSVGAACAGKQWGTRIIAGSSCHWSGQSGLRYTKCSSDVPLHSIGKKKKRKKKKFLMSAKGIWPPGATLAPQGIRATERPGVVCRKSQNRQTSLFLSLSGLDWTKRFSTCFKHNSYPFNFGRGIQAVGFCSVTNQSFSKAGAGWPMHKAGVETVLQYDMHTVWKLGHLKQP